MAPPLLTVRSGAVVAAFHDRALAEAWLGDNLRPLHGSVQQSQSSGDDVQIPDGLCVMRPGQVGKLPPPATSRTAGVSKAAGGRTRLDSEREAAQVPHLDAASDCSCRF